ncbi:pyruvate carboxylase [Mycoplana sp. BE70]|nr:pyruvate carboxylase [Mycoplana sp. BE70]
MPTHAYFYGMASGEELFGDIEKGMVKVFFELNGQPRPIKVPDRNRGASSAARRKAEAGNAAHLGAPMPGVVSTVAVEAMKMETALHAEKECTIAEVLVRAGDQIDAS